MGISILSSYRGGYKFEAVGLSRWLVNSYFPGLNSRISGIGLYGIRRKVLTLHHRAFSEGATALPVGGFYRFRQNGEGACLRRPADAYPADRGRERFLRHLPEVRRRHAKTRRRFTCAT